MKPDNIFVQTYKSKNGEGLDWGKTLQMKQRGEQSSVTRPTQFWSFLIICKVRMYKNW